MGGLGLNLVSVWPFAICGAIWGAMGGAVGAQIASLPAKRLARIWGAVAGTIGGALVGAIAGAVLACKLPLKPPWELGLYGRMSEVALLGILAGAIVIALRGVFTLEVVPPSSRQPSRIWNVSWGAGWGGVVGLITGVTLVAIWHAAVVAIDNGSMGLAIQEAIQGAGWGATRGPIVGLVSGAIGGALKA